MVFLNLPETREERFRRKVRREVLCEIRSEEEKRRAEVIREVRQDARIEAEKQHCEAMAEANARCAAWYARMKEAQDKDEPFDEPPPWEQ